MKIVYHRTIPVAYKIKSATISLTSSGKYYASILTEYETTIPTIKLDKDNSLGLDYSSHSFYVDSQGKEANYPKFYHNAQEKLAKEQRKLSHMKYSSNNYSKQKVRVAKISEHISNQRKDWLHKLSTELSTMYDYICVEDIDMRSMSQSLKLGKSTMDNGFGMFRTFLEYKLSDKGKRFIVIDRWFPSSKMCRFCGTVYNDLKLSDRVWTCSCGKTLNRDENAAINIKNEGMRLVFA